MERVKEIWVNSELRCGGFYELAMEISDNNLSSKDSEKFIKSIFEIEFIKGPFDEKFNATEITIDAQNGYDQILGYIEIEENKIPFKIVFISEEGEIGSNWVHLCFCTGIYTEILEEEYLIGKTNYKSHKGLDELLIKTLIFLNSKNKIRLGLIGFEVSGMYDLNWLKENELENNDISYISFYVNKDEKIKNRNMEKILKI